jgi:xanthine dehydrogenase accessory factor
VYDIALAVSACQRSGTRADVAWMLSPRTGDEALAFTPGGGRLGTLCGGAFDGLLADVSGRQLPAGRLVRHTVTELESGLSGLSAGTPAEFLVVPVAQIPAALWGYLLQREPVAITVDLADDEVVGVTLSTVDGAEGPGRDLLQEGRTASAVIDTGRVWALVPVPRLVIAGQGPFAEALAAQGRLLDWKVLIEPRPDAVAGVSASLSPLDAIVVMGHDVESSSRNLMSALEGEAGYIGALGSRAMQQSRADWLAYRDVTDLDRVHGPAGLAIGARTPAEIAVAIVAEILAARDA